MNLLEDDEQIESQPGSGSFSVDGRADPLELVVLALNQTGATGVGLVVTRGIPDGPGRGLEDANPPTELAVSAALALTKAARRSAVLARLLPRAAQVLVAEARARTHRVEDLRGESRRNA